MKLSEILSPTAVRVPLRATSKERSIEELVELLEQTHAIDSGGEILRVVMARESLMSTAIGHGVAIPHAKARAVRSIVAACGVSSSGLEYESIDGEPVRLVVLLVSPETARGNHVRALAAISRLMLDQHVRQGLVESPDPESFFRRLESAEVEVG